MFCQLKILKVDEVDKEAFAFISSSYATMSKLDTKTCGDILLEGGAGPEYAFDIAGPSYLVSMNKRYALFGL